MPGTCDRARPHDAAKLKDVLATVYRDEVPDLVGITNFEWALERENREVTKATVRVVFHCLPDTTDPDRGVHHRVVNPSSGTVSIGPVWIRHREPRDPGARETVKRRRTERCVLTTTARAPRLAASGGEHHGLRRDSAYYAEHRR